MKTSSGGLAFITAQEGCVLHQYKDSTGRWTIGVGHLIKPGEHFGAAITQAQAQALLASDVAWAEAAVSACVKVPLTQNQFDALVDFAFNEGPGALPSSTALRLLNAGDYAGAAAALEMWCKDESGPGGALVVDPVLLNRRKAEAALFLRPVDQQVQ